MSRPRKWRRVCCLPESDHFGPLGMAPNAENFVHMSVDEYETIRLIDLENMTQEECASRMNIARTTVQGIYNDARKKLAQSLVNGKVLWIEGGEYELCDGQKKPCGQGGCHRRGCLGSDDLQIRVLVENKSENKDLKSEHGLSLYIETKKHKVLFDTGASALFAENAEKMGIDLASVDLAVLSHGHYDHGGGLAVFLEKNKNAKVYLQAEAFGEHYANSISGEKKYIGLDQGLLPNERFVFTKETFVIDEELELFSGAEGELFCPSGNAQLFVRNKGVFEPDRFFHEQNLMIRESGKTVLVAGCAHNGIVNILEAYRKKYKNYPDFVIGGFHLYDRSFNKNEDPETVDAIGKYLLETGAMFYTCHCTGTESYNRLKSVMGDKIDYLSTGSQKIL